MPLAYSPLYFEFVSNGTSSNIGFEFNWAADAVTSLYDPTSAILSIPGVAVAGEFVGVYADPTDYNVDFNWDFGNGDTSNENAATTSYDTPGKYTITLTTSNCFGDTAIERTVNVKRDQSIDIPTMIVYPSPSNGKFTVFENYRETPSSIDVISLIGQILVQ